MLCKIAFRTNNVKQTLQTIQAFMDAQAYLHTKDWKQGSK